MYYDLLYSNENNNSELIKEGDSKSKSNKDEADFIVILVARIIEILWRDRFMNLILANVRDKIGIITPYK